MPITRRGIIATGGSSVAALATGMGVARAAGKQLAYLTPGLDLPFWRILAKGIDDTAKAAGGSSTAYDSHNNAQTQLQNAQDAIARKVDGILISPTDSSTCPAVLNLAKRAGIPAVIADIGTTSGDYVSFIISDNYQGANGIGEVLAKKMTAKSGTKGTVGLVTISLARNNGKARTDGFMKAMEQAGIKQAALSQMQTYTADETLHFVQDMLTAHPDLGGLFVETDQPTLGALRAISAAHKEGQVLVAAFDGIPEFVDLIKKGTIVGSGMQQPYLMGQRSAEALLDQLAGKTPEKQILVPIQVVTQDNIAQLEPTIRKTVFGE
ncbi:MAG TPA: substrate-binding domain-containing protein [Acetobacteraceae bacterium]|nr:substrate-binding domain-containing protein [Acetobacteraceae bacterium]